MVTGVLTDECTVAVSADLLWKVCFGDASARSAVLPKACAGFIDAVEVEGAITTMKYNPAVGEASVVKSRTLVMDAAARVMRTEVLEGGKVRAQLKSQVNEVKVEAAGENACVVKAKVEYESISGEPLAAEDQAKLTKYLGLIKKVEAYLAAHPDEFA